MKTIMPPTKQVIDALGIAKIQRHIFLCADQTKPKCCGRKVSLESWDYLKNRLNELGLTQASNNDQIIFRTKANCLRVCERGPIAVVYSPHDKDNPAVWYHSCTPEVLEEIIQEHLIKGNVLSQYQINTE